MFLSGISGYFLNCLESAPTLATIHSYLKQNMYGKRHFSRQCKAVVLQPAVPGLVQQVVLAYHVLLAMVEFNLAKGESGNQHIDTSCDETVVSNLVIEFVDGVGRLLIIVHVFLFERHILYQHCRVGGEENTQHCQHYDSPDADDNTAGGQLGTAK